MKKQYFLFLIFCTSLVFARPLSPYTEKEKELIVQQGQLFTIQVWPKEPVKFYVLGREEARIDPQSLKIKVRRLTPYPAQDLPIRFEEDYYVISGSSAKLPLNEIEITTTTKQNKEVFKINLQKH